MDAVEKISPLLDDLESMGTFFLPDDLLKTQLEVWVQVVNASDVFNIAFVNGDKIILDLLAQGIETKKYGQFGIRVDILDPDAQKVALVTDQEQN